MTTRTLSLAIALLFVGAAVEDCTAAQSTAPAKKAGTAAKPLARPAAPAPIPVLNARLRFIGATRTKTLSGASGGGFSATWAAEGREFIVLKYELAAPTRDDLPGLRYAKIELANGEMFFESGTGTNPRSETEVEVEQAFNVPQGMMPRALHFAKLASDPAGGNRPLWTSAARVDLSKLKFVPSKE